MNFGKLRSGVLAVGMLAGTLSCSDSNTIDPNNPNNTGPTAGRYIRWTSQSTNGDNGAYYSASLVKGSRIYQSPYTSSIDGVTWTTEPNDNLWRQFEKFGGYFVAEVKNSAPSGTVSNVRVYTPLSGTGSITVNKSAAGISNMAWEGGNTIYAIANNAGGLYGGAWDDDFIIKSTNGGSTWAPITHQPPKAPYHLSFDNIWLIDGKLFVLDFINSPGGYTDYKLYLAVDQGLSGFWSESVLYSDPIGLHGVPGIGGIAIYATDKNGTYQIEIKGTTFVLNDLKFESGVNASGKVVGLASVNGGNNTTVFVNTFGFYIIDPVTQKFYDPSEKSLPGVGGIVVFGNELVVTAGSSVYKTPFPFVFHETP